MARQGTQRRKINLPVGHRFGQLTVTREPRLVRGHLYVECRCDCGAEKPIRQDHLTRDVNVVVSCGCHRAIFKLKHGSARKNRALPTEYKIWLKMRDRCANPNNKGFHKYGGRGIKVCDRWNDFAAFLADMGPRPSDAHSLDRYPDNDGPYSPDNCRWATRKEQARNTRTNRRIEINGMTRSVAEWAEVMGISADTIRARLHDGWEPQSAITTPLIPKGYSRPTPSEAAA